LQALATTIQVFDRLLINGYFKTAKMLFKSKKAFIKIENLEKVLCPKAGDT
jgi:hypothetical protein